MSGDGTISIAPSAEAAVNGSLSRQNITLNNLTASQTVEVKADSSTITDKTYYSFSCKIKKTAVGSCLIRITDGTEAGVWEISLANGTRSFTWSCPWYSGTRSYTCSGYIPSGVVAPSTPSVSLTSKTYNSATFNISISSYGVPSGTSGRYIEAAILGQNSYGNSYRYSTRSNTASATITVNNSSNTGSTALTIEGNHKYWYGGYASNTQAHNSVVTGTFYTPCPPLASLSLSSQTYSTHNTVNAILSYTRQADGGAETRTGYYRYSTDSGATYSSWISFGTISVATGTAATFTAKLPTSSNVIIQTKISTPNGGDSTFVSTSFSTSATHTAPNFSDFEYTDDNSATVALTGNNQTMIQGQSTPLVTISTANKATGNNGVAVSNYAITFVGQSKTITYSSSESVSASLNAPSESGTANLVVSAVDSLSLSTAVTKSVTIYPWSAPTISASIERVNNFESQSTLKISGTYAPITIENEAKNSLTVSYRTKNRPARTGETGLLDLRPSQIVPGLLLIYQFLWIIITNGISRSKPPIHLLL